MLRHKLKGSSALLLLALLLVACGDFTEATRVRLELSPTADFSESFQMVVAQLSEGAVCDSRLCIDGQTREFTQRLDGEQLAELLAALDAAGVQELGDGDSGGPEASVLYTRLSLTSGALYRRTVWRGLPPQHESVAQALLLSPLGPTLREGLEAVQRRKLEISAPALR